MYDSFISTIVGFSVKVHPLKICLSIQKKIVSYLLLKTHFICCHGYNFLILLVENSRVQQEYNVSIHVVVVVVGIRSWR
jgi:hypothetical protein